MRKKLTSHRRLNPSRDSLGSRKKRRRSRKRVDELQKSPAGNDCVEDVNGKQVRVPCSGLSNPSTLKSSEPENDSGNFCLFIDVAPKRFKPEKSAKLSSERKCQARCDSSSKCQTWWFNSQSGVCSIAEKKLPFYKMVPTVDVITGQRGCDAKAVF